MAPLGGGLRTGAGAVLNELRPRPGAVLAVTGAGAVGLAGVMAARMTPAATVIAVDRVASRLALARELGADVVVDTTDTPVADALHDLTGGCGVDLALETTGSTAVLEALVGSLAVGGQCAVVGAPPAGARAAFDVNRLLPGRVVRGVTLGDSEPQTFLPELVRAHRAGRFPFDRLLRTYPFAEIERAVADAASGRVVKPVLTFEDR
jgi:aryl-alcohol dehydrogenase